jgi:hypothetical protein
MFCTQCGTPFDLGQNFCKHCGARVNQQPGLETPTQTAKRETTQATIAPEARAKPVAKATDDALRFSTSRERRGVRVNVLVGACLALLLAGSAAIYFGTDLFRQAVRQEAPVVADTPASTDANSSRLRRGEGAKNSSESVTDNLSSARQSQQAQTPPPVPADSPEPPPAISPKAAPKTDGTESARKSQSPRVGQDTEATVRAKRPPAAAARRGGTGGIYETTRSTTVFESPSASSQVLADIPGGTRIDVVNANGQWLEVHSRRGNPPGFIRREDATFVEKTE